MVETYGEDVIMGIQDAMRSFINMTGKGNNSGMTDYQQEAIYMKRYESERAEGLLQIAGIDSQAKLMESQGEDYKAYLQQNKPLYERWAPYRIQDGVVVSNIDVADAISTRLQRETTDADNSIKLLESQVLKASLDKSNDKGELEAELRDAWAIKKQLIASGPQIMNTKLALVEADNKAINAGRDADPIKTPERTKEWNAQLETNKKLIESIIKTGGARDYSLPSEDANTDTDIIKGLDTGKETPPPNSDFEVSDTNAKATQYAGEKEAQLGEGIREAIMKVPKQLLDSTKYVGQKLLDSPSEIIRGASGLMGTKVPGFAKTGQPDLLTQMLNSRIGNVPSNVINAIKSPQKLEAPSIGSIDRIGNAIGSKEAPLWQEKYTDPMSEMLYKLLYKKDAGLPGAR